MCDERNESERCVCAEVGDGLPEIPTEPCDHCGAAPDEVHAVGCAALPGSPPIGRSGPESKQGDG